MRSPTLKKQSLSFDPFRRSILAGDSIPGRGAPSATRVTRHPHWRVSGCAPWGFSPPHALARFGSMCRSSTPATACLVVSAPPTAAPADSSSASAARSDCPCGSNSHGNNIQSKEQNSCFSNYINKGVLRSYAPLNKPWQGFVD